MFLLKPKFIFPLALISGLAASYAAYLYLEEYKKNIQNTAQTQTVVVAAQPLSLGATVGANNLEIKYWPEAIIPKGYFETLADLEGRVVKTEVMPGEAILASKLAPEGSRGGLSSLVPPGMRAMTVAVNVVSGVGGFILPGTRVDILSTFATSNSKNEIMTKVILQNVQVLAVDQTYENEDDDPMTVKSVTMIVTPVQAEELALVSNEGQLQLTLRNSTDEGFYDTKGVKLSQFIGKPKPKPRKRRRTTTRPKPTSRVVEVIRGNERSEVTLRKKEKINSPYLAAAPKAWIPSF